VPAASDQESRPDIAVHKSSNAKLSAPAVIAALESRSLVLVGMMGAGKSSIGRRLAARLEIRFVDADAEIERAAGMSVSDIFAKHGESSFRSGEARVIARLLEAGPQVLATGGGAFMNADTRALIGRKGISVWLKAEYEILMRRIRRRSDRPLLNTENPAETLQRLIDERYPIYGQADVTVHSRDVPHDTIVDEILAAVAQRIGACNRTLPGGER
jgi:shikimate kinase